MKTQVICAKILACAVCIGLAGCETTDAVGGADRQHIGVEGQDQVCAGRFADKVGVPMSSVRVNSHDTSPAGHTVVFMQTSDRRGTCEVTDFGDIVSLNVLR